MEPGLRADHIPAERDVMDIFCCLTMIVLRGVRLVRHGAPHGPRTRAEYYRPIRPIAE
jgi:hypothetical protein